MTLDKSGLQDVIVQDELLQGNISKNEKNNEVHLNIRHIKQIL
jgi:hypothetical protein